MSGRRFFLFPKVYCDVVDPQVVLFGVAVQIFNGILMRLAVHLGTTISQRTFCFLP